MKGRRSSSRAGIPSPNLGLTAADSPPSMDHPPTTTATAATLSGRVSRSVPDADSLEKTSSTTNHSNNKTSALAERPKRTSTRVRSSSVGNLGTATAQPPQGATTIKNNNATTKKTNKKAPAAATASKRSKPTTTSESGTAATIDSNTASSLRRGPHPRVSTRQRRHHHPRSATPSLTAILDAAPIAVRIVLDQLPYYLSSSDNSNSYDDEEEDDEEMDDAIRKGKDPSDKVSPVDNINKNNKTAGDLIVNYAEDGNQFNCQVCSEFGNVVCCDGCPRVYHHQCVPAGPSRQSLDQDDDPWYCPECTSTTATTSSSSANKDSAAEEAESLVTMGEAGAAATTNTKQQDNVIILAPSEGTSRLSGRRRFTSQNKCADCLQDRPEMALAPCRGCGAYVHAPSCDPLVQTEADNGKKGKNKKDKKNIVTYCTNCRMIDREEDDDDEGEAIERDHEALVSRSHRGVAKKHRSDKDEQQQLNASVNSNSRHGNSKANKQASAGETTTKRKLHRKRSASSLSPADGTGRKKKKKKRRKTSMSSVGGDDDGGSAAAGDHHQDTDDDDDIPEPTEPPVKAMPAFCFYLAENRFKIERALSKSHRTFNRMPKGDERNAVIAGEAVEWWTTQLSDSERREYIAMSMRDFEARVVQWKEEKTIQAMQMGEDEEYLASVDDAVAGRKLNSSGAGGDVDLEGTSALDDGKPASTATTDASRGDSSYMPGASLSDAHGVANAEPLVGSSAAVATAGFGNSRTDALLTYEKHERLFLDTSVGSKPFKPEPGQSYNRVLLDILHDMRFHPLPMFCVNRPEHADQVIDEHNAKVTIPYFDVHGPISTSIGDECLGCSRGWTHYCSVLQRRIPAVEHRARLQPPLSSLVSTRIGLGLRPRLESVPPLQTNNDSSSSSAVLFQWRDSDEARKIKALPIFPSATLTDPSERMDDLVHFIEETTAMKVPEPPRPIFPDKVQWQKQQQQHRRPLPLHQSLRQELAMTPDGRVFNKCGRCRTLVETDTGCHQCRRAQLVIHKSRKFPSDTSKSSIAGGPAEVDKSLLKVHTAVLGRVQTREINIDALSETDQHLSEGMLKERWCPSAILPPQTTHVPTPKAEAFIDEDESSGSTDDVFHDSVSESIDNNSSVTSFHSTTATNLGKGKSDDDSSGIIPMETIPEESGDLVEAASHGEESGEGTSKPQKRARLARTVVAVKEIDDRNQKHQDIHKIYKKESTELQRKTIQVSCYAILLALVRRDPFHVFAEPVNAEDYTTLVQRPIDFGIIREKLLSEKYTSLSGFVSDVKLLCNNALAYNPPASLYYKTAKDMLDVVDIMQKRAFDWIGTIKDTHSNYLLHQHHRRPTVMADAGQGFTLEPFEELREKWPEAVQMLESEETLRKRVESDFMRTQENELAYYGALAVRRSAAAAEASLASYPDTLGKHNAVAKRTFYEDEELRQYVDSKVIMATQPMTLQNVSTWREESLVRLMRKVQKIRLERKTITEHGCSRCDGVLMDNEWKSALNADSTHPGKPRKKGDGDVPRVDHTRILLSTGLGSAKTCQKIVSRQRNDGIEDSGIDSIRDASVSVRGSRVHGMGLFADQPFAKGDVVAEYIGEYIVNPVAEKREKLYGEQRIQDYQFRIDDKLIIDATKNGGHGRYINHNCTPNCRAKIISGEPPNEHLRRVIIVAQRSIDLNEEITYDYQFPLELDLEARIPCNCQSDACRGFMNWDLPEKGSNNRALLVQKRGANMRDRIRRLGRPLKRDEAY